MRFEHTQPWALFPAFVGGCLPTVASPGQVRVGWVLLKPKKYSGSKGGDCWRGRKKEDRYDLS